MIGQRDATQWAEQLGVAVDQIHRDHLVSHVLAVLPSIARKRRHVFIGGTALARSHLAGLRVSEDVDLLVEDVDAYGQALARKLPGLVRRYYPDLQVGPALHAPRGLRLQLRAAGSPGLQVHLLRLEAAEAGLDFERRLVILRYRELPEHVELTLPTAESFVAMKFAAYRDRREPRDLFDLAHLAVRGAVSERATELIAQLTGARPQAAELRRLPDLTRRTWSDRLRHQTRDLLGPEAALAQLREALLEAMDVKDPPPNGSGQA